jgi:hypothetical protein
MGRCAEMRMIKERFGDGVDRGRPEVDRRVLRDILLDSIEAANIEWGRKLVKVEQKEGRNMICISQTGKSRKVSISSLEQTARGRKSELC